MTSKRLFLLLSAVMSLLLVVAPARATDSGGAEAPIIAQDPSGGVIAPFQADPAVPEVEADAAQQETTPTTPGGEEQPPNGETETDQGTTTEETGGTSPGTGNEGETGAGGESGGLPQTGLQIAALAMIGLGLLMAGLALRPTSSWPPPRGRLSRSMPPR